ncbi:MAG: 1-deoxy-D-xylulose-5-phosphate synthase [Acidimicrobiia bacterium]|nr:1-deoxy-D-xylulose-5-phosphate synthase [Acidimicrobiia bacterium]
MLLETISRPADIRRLSYDELGTLAVEIRQFIVDAVTRSGGHLGSNLGAVELTFALHRVFESPRDIILWDTGHQAYVHKILTGRRDDFVSLRQTDGLSGYPSRSESEHDWIENSHASTIVSYAHGLATAVEMGATPTDDRGVPAGSERHVVAVIGDGSMTGGMAFEGLNNLGHSGRRAIIILNDNGRSYAPTVSKLTESVARLRLNPAYLRQRARLEQLLDRLPLSGQLHKGLEATTAALREYFEPRAFFEDLGVRYTGPFDGHDVEGLERAMRDAAKYPGPIVVHVLTQKGRGYAPAENDPVKRLHDMKPARKAGGVADESDSKPSSYTTAFAEALCKAGQTHPELVAITAAMPDSTGLLPFGEQFPGRLIDVGIAEQHAVTAACGMAMGGLRPVVALYSTFLTRAFDQVMYDVGLHRQPVVFSLDRAGITGDDGASHHGVLDMVLLSKVPGMTLLAPSSYQELGQMLEDALAVTDGPVAIRFPKTPARSVPDEQVGAGLRGRLVRSGSDVCILSIGKLLEDAEAAAATLAAEGIEATVWDVRCCKPLDADLLADAAAHPAIVTCEDGLAEGGIGSAIVDAVGRIAADDDRSPPPVGVLGVPTRFHQHGKPDQILARLGLDAAGIAAEVRRVVL